jgi:hypothetical protein
VRERMPVAGAEGVRRGTVAIARGARVFPLRSVLYALARTTPRQQEDE